MSPTSSSARIEQNVKLREKLGLLIQGLLSVFLVGGLQYWESTVIDDEELVSFLKVLKVVSPFISAFIMVLALYILRDRLAVKEALKNVNLFYSAEYQDACKREEEYLSKIERVKGKDTKLEKKYRIQLDKVLDEKNRIVELKNRGISDTREQLT